MTKRRGLHRRASAFAVLGVLAAACGSGELSSDEAAERLSEHLQVDVLATFGAPEDGAFIEIEPVELIFSGEHRRKLEAELRMSDEGLNWMIETWELEGDEAREEPEGESGEDGEQGTVEAEFTRAEEGWRLTEYGDDLVWVVANWATVDLETTYDPVYQEITRIGEELSERRQQEIEARIEGRDRGEARQPGDSPKEVAQNVIEELEPPVPDWIEIDFVEPDYGADTVIRLRATPEGSEHEIVCVRPAHGRSTGDYPVEYLWAEEAYGAACEGGPRNWIGVWETLDAVQESLEEDRIWTGW